MNKEDLKCAPFVVWGISRAIGNMVLKPLAQTLLSKLPLPSQEEIDSHIEASVQFYRTPEL